MNRLFTLVVLCSLLVLTNARADAAKDSFDQGQALIAKADFAAALAPLEAAAKADPANATYTKRLAAITKVVDYRKQMETVTDLKKYDSLGRALRSFYLREKLNGEALTLAEKMNAKLATPASAVYLAETQLACDKNEDAIKTIQSLPADKVTVSAQALLAIGYVEVGKLDDAKAVLAKVTIPDNALPGAKYIVARAYGKIGDAPKAIATLKTFFEAVPPTQLDALKAQAKSLDEFAAFASTPEFVEVLKTESKIKLSDCTGGSDCSTCPQGQSCPEGEKKQEKK